MNGIFLLNALNPYSATYHQKAQNKFIISRIEHYRAGLITVEGLRIVIVNLPE
jgi:hypothetical protein